MDEFKTLVAAVHGMILASAARSLVTATDPLRWHATLFRDFVPVEYYAGHYRGQDTARPCLATDVGVGGGGTFVAGCPHQFVRPEIDRLFNRAAEQVAILELHWADLTPSKRAIQLAIITANLVGEFIRIHPFINGNGRTSRLLWRWCLLRFGVPVQCCTHPRPTPPYSKLMAEAMAGNYRPLAIFVLDHLSHHSPSRN